MMNTEEDKKKPKFKAGVDLTAKVNLTHSTYENNSTIMRIWIYLKSKLFYQKNQ